MYVHTRSSHDPSSKVKASYSGRSATMEVVAALGAAACCCACVLGICMLSSRWWAIGAVTLFKAHRQPTALADVISFNIPCSNCNQLCQARRRRNELLSECHYVRSSVLLHVHVRRSTNLSDKLSCFLQNRYIFQKRPTCQNEVSFSIG